MYDFQIEKIIKKGNEFYDKLKKDENCRYKSWEYCYKVFYDLHQSEDSSEEAIDYLCLHLSFYLASWGMYRGSSFLLQTDYKVHKKVVEKILSHRYDKLWNINVKEYSKDNINLLMDLVKEIKEIYNDIRLSIEKYKGVKNEISNTLVTKVLMGTTGCVPAYDRYFVEGVKKFGKLSGTFNKKSIKSVADFYNEHYEELEEARRKMKINNIEYPQMKVIDMCFWKIGFDLQMKKT